MAVNSPPVIKRGQKTKRLNVYVTPSEYNAIVSASNHDRTSSISEWARQRLTQGLKINRPFDELDIPMASPLGRSIIEAPLSGSRY